ncbi:hypothetical protein [Spirosoma spitsbergense]|uniref:hypothetical protein n=1 Tax=Spirosoma spitsbergense TaxID=431554 RepID=UPI000370DC8D|nr:hypothetical protein [Spirosoma spitsbergense]
MTWSLFRYFWLTLFTGCFLTDTLWAQQPAVAGYHVKVKTSSGNYFSGLLQEVTSSYLYIGNDPYEPESRIPLDDVLKVVIRRQNKKNAVISGAVVGGLMLGFITNQSLQRVPPRSLFTYGLILTFAAAGGAAGGALAGSTLHNVSTSRTIRPPKNEDASLNLFRQLEPYSARYQQDFINRLPQTNN